jgi:PGF-pre-PGF domain-containing protein
MNSKKETISMIVEKTILCMLLLLVGAVFATGVPSANAGSDQSVNVYDTASFSGAASTCSVCSIVSYNWNFGDGQGASGVSTTHSYTSSAVYTATLVVVSNQGQISSDTMSVTVSASDSIAPSITHTPAADGTNSTAITIYSTITDNVGVSTATLYYRKSNESTYSSTAMSGSGTTYSGTIPAAFVTMENVSYYLEALDAASNTACAPAASAPCNSTYYNTTVSAADTTPPVTSLIRVSTDTVSPYYDVSNDNATTILVSGESSMSCRYATSDSTYGNMLSSNTCLVTGSQANCSLSLAQGTYSYYVSCKDGSNNSQNTSQNLDINFTIDWTAPSGGSLNAAAGANGSVSLSWTPANDTASGLSIQKVYRDWILKISLVGNSTSWTDTSTVGAVTYNYSICGTDAAGNVQSNATCMNASVTTDASQPAITAVGPSTTQNSSNVTLTAATNEAASCRYSTSSGYVYSNMTLNFSSTGGTSHSKTLNLSSGSYVYYVSCKDTAGNEMNISNSTSFTVAISSTTPEVPGAACTESWSCTSWSACAGGTQTRACTDANSCGTTTNKPAEAQNCGTAPPQPPSNVTPPGQPEIIPPVTPPVTPTDNERVIVTTRGGAIISIPTIAAESRASASITPAVAAVTSIDDIILNSKKEMKNIRLRVEKMDEKPSSIAAPPGQVYKYIEIAAENITSDNLESATIKFSVEKAWFGTKYNMSTVALMRYTTAWTELQTTMTGQNATHYIFEATTPGFSYFAITAEEAAAAPPAAPSANETVPGQEAAKMDYTPMIVLLALIAVVAIAYWLIGRKPGYRIPKRPKVQEAPKSQKKKGTRG